MILHSPTERGAVIRRLHDVAGGYGIKVKSSSTPEPLGVDFTWIGHDGEFYGVQRKEFKDYLASLDDGRLAKEIAQMNANIQLPLLVLEGRVQVVNGLIDTGRWGNDMTYASWQSRMFTIAAAGVQVLYTNTASDTAETIVALYRWTQNPRHSTASSRPKPKNDWGKPTNRQWQLHLLTSLDGIGVQTAEAILDTLGRCPVEVTATVDELVQVPGVGKKTAEKIIRSINGDGEGEP